MLLGADAEQLGRNETDDKGESPQMERGEGSKICGGEEAGRERKREFESSRVPSAGGGGKGERTRKRAGNEWRRWRSTTLEGPVRAPGQEYTLGDCSPSSERLPAARPGAGEGLLLCVCPLVPLDMLHTSNTRGPM